MSLFSDIASSINLGGNWLLILIFLGAGFVGGAALGRSRLNLILLSSYLSFIINKFIPWKVFLSPGTLPDPNVQTFIFLAVILTIFFFGPHSGFSSMIKIGGRGRGSWWQLGILGALLLGFLVSAVISFLPAKTLSDLSPLIKQYFSDPLPQFLWLLLPLVAAFVLKKKRMYSYGDED